MVQELGDQLDLAEGAGVRIGDVQPGVGVHLPASYRHARQAPVGFAMRLFDRALLDTLAEGCGRSEGPRRADLPQRLWRLTQMLLR
jgi:hypothetical protein